ncbi:dTDP-glucose 4,6-dehydratase [Oscillibacter sp.]|uniref:dTDP-glucose 4,6-dehydratase n=1 Tax=Oscillibacter sp. TaxID=1945593 RepID=UPI002897159F|nr:dTDP-glucose 4,6-dehydratase [Oscillibacter sp.]
MRLLITGGAGFIGSNFIFHLRAVRPDWTLLCVDKLTYAGNLATLDSVRDDPHFRFFRADITDETAMRGIFETERPDAVVNFAAESHVDRSIEDPGIFLRTNVLGVQTLLDVCRSCGVSRFHQVSTDEVYGDLPLDRPDLRFTEESPLRPSSPYAASKAAADLLCGAYRRTYGLHVTLSRCSNNYGPFQFPEKLIPLMLANALADQPLPVYGTGENVRDWLYVDDHCAAIRLILEKGEAGAVYNIGGHGELSNLALVRRLLALVGKSESLITHVGDRKGHDLRYAIDPVLLEKTLGWRPAVSLDEGLAKTVAWYLEHRLWWETIRSGAYLSYYERMYGNRPAPDRHFDGGL